MPILQELSRYSLLRLPLLLSSFLLITSVVSGQSLPSRLSTYLQKLPATARVSLAVEPLQPDSVAAGQSMFAHRADVPVPSASLIKLPILVEAMEWVKAGRLDPDEIHILVDSEKAGGTGVLAAYPSRSRVSYRDLITLMITHSDNTATNVLIQEIGFEAVNQRMQALGLTHTRLNRMMMDTAAVKRGLDNYVAAGELNTLLKKLAGYELATPALCREMLEMLKRCDDQTTIPRLLPKTVAVAHKTGTLTYVRGDAGIVYARRPFVLSVLVQGTNPTDAESIIGEIALICYRFFEQ
ncbi:serine hydrolase [Nibrella viscosa]